MQRIPPVTEIADLLEEKSTPKKLARVTFACDQMTKDFFTAASAILGSESFAEAVRRGSVAYVTALIDEKRRRTQSSVTAGAIASLPSDRES